MAVKFTKQSLKVISVKQRVKYLKLLFKWKGGVWDLLWVDFIWFLGAHILVTIFYQFILMRYPKHRRNFESFLEYMDNLRNLVPLSFLLGFFVSAVLVRWWSIVMLIPWISKASIYCQSYVTGKLDDKEINVPESIKEKELYKIRMSILRYLNMSWVFLFVSFSISVRKRFYIRKSSKSKMKQVTKQFLKSKDNDRITVRERVEFINSDSIVKKYYEQFILDEEIEFFESREQVLPKDKTLNLDYWIPIQWSLIVIKKAYNMGIIPHPIFYAAMIDMVNEFRSQLKTLSIYNDWKMPLVYIQVVIFVVYSFLFTEIFTQQIISENDVNIRRFHFQTYFPILSILKYFLYMGWFQIGLCLMYPFEGNNADMPLNDVLDFNLKAGTQGCRTTPDLFPAFLRQEFGTDEDQMKKLTELNGEYETTVEGFSDSEMDDGYNENLSKLKNIRINDIV